MINNLTDKEIKKALECCSNYGLFKRLKCPKGRTSKTCMYDLSKDALDLINRKDQEKQNLKAEVERLKDFATSKCADCAGCTSWKCDCANIKAEAYKECLEKVKTKARLVCTGHGEAGFVVDVFDIDNLLNELVGEDNESKA